MVPLRRIVLVFCTLMVRLRRVVDKDSNIIHLFFFVHWCFFDLVILYTDGSLIFCTLMIVGHFVHWYSVHSWLIFTLGSTILIFCTLIIVHYGSPILILMVHLFWYFVRSRILWQYVHSRFFDILYTGIFVNSWFIYSLIFRTDWALGICILFWIWAFKVFVESCLH